MRRSPFRKRGRRSMNMSSHNSARRCRPLRPMGVSHGRPSAWKKRKAACAADRRARRETRRDCRMAEAPGRGNEEGRGIGCRDLFEDEARRGGAQFSAMDESGAAAILRAQPARSETMLNEMEPARAHGSPQKWLASARVVKSPGAHHEAVCVSRSLSSIAGCSRLEGSRAASPP